MKMETGALNYCQLSKLSEQQLEEYFESHVLSQNRFLILPILHKGIISDLNREKLKTSFITRVEWVRKKLKLSCHVCLSKGKETVALYRVGDMGFCKEHYEDGVKAEKRRQNRQKVFAIKNQLWGGGVRRYSFSSLVAERVRDIHASDFQITETTRLNPCRSVRATARVEGAKETLY